MLAGRKYLLDTRTERTYVRYMNANDQGWEGGRMFDLDADSYIPGSLVADRNRKGRNRRQAVYLGRFFRRGGKS